MNAHPTHKPILTAAKYWTDRCLLHDGSVFSDKSIWNASVLDEFKIRFIDNFMEGDQKFFTKFKEQLSPGSPEMKQFAAELLWALYLFPGGVISVAKKAEQVKMVWEWSGATFPADSKVPKSFDEHIGNPGTAFNTLRWREMSYLWRVTSTFKNLDVNKRARLLKQPWEFVKWLDDIPDSSHRQMRHILLHLIFPEQFERIASAGHKDRIRDAFSEKLIADPASMPKNLSKIGQRDWELLKIREQLTSENPTGILDFYEPPLSNSWSRKDAPKTAKKTTKVKNDPVPYGTKKPHPESRQYWWLNASPKVWDFKKLPIGDTESYTALNEKGNKRQKFKYFRLVKPGDVVIGYLTTPAKQIASVCEVTKGMKETGNQGFEFRKTEDLSKPISWEDLQAMPQLKGCEPMLSNQGSLFKVTTEEYEFLRSLFDKQKKASPIAAYSREDALEDLFLSEQKFDRILSLLRRKKNIILQGPPGVGKTFIARRLAYALMKEKDESRAPMIQFHQSYSYEDFIQGYRPDGKGGFFLKNGIFHTLCRRAQSDSGRDYFLVIDEINRGNLGKIFGELMMLMEADKRGPEFAIQLSYSESIDDTFHIPENLYLIGTMNTADRSLALVDYALRRRFAFITLEPEFSSAKFQVQLEGKGAADALVNRIVQRMNSLNQSIYEDKHNLGWGYRIGHSFFCPSDGTCPNEEWYQQVIEYEIAPLLREYWIDLEERVDAELAKLLS